MTILEQSLTKQSVKIPKLIILAFFVVSLIGFLDATYLTVKYYLGTPINCSIFQDCEKVITSSYATIGGIPMALLGAVYYLGIFILTVVYFDTKRESILIFTSRLTIIGFLVSLGLLYLQLFVIKAICLYCAISAITSTILFLLGLFTLKLQKQKSKESGCLSPKF